MSMITLNNDHALNYICTYIRIVYLQTDNSGSVHPYGVEEALGGSFGDEAQHN